MKIGNVVLASFCAIVIAGCGDSTSPSGKKANSLYVPSGVAATPMVFPAGDKTTFKKFLDYDKPVSPAPYSHPGKWMVYMAATGWTNEGLDIVTRLSQDASQMRVIQTFLYDNNLSNDVHTAWIQYDMNPSPEYLESLEKVPSNYIPIFLKMVGPPVNYFIHSPVSRTGTDAGHLRYDAWLKPYMSHTKKVGGLYETTSDFHKLQGYDKYPSEYWDHWARHFFIVNPDGVVVDAYLSNMGNVKSYGAKTAIHSLIHHLKLDYAKIKVPDVQEINYKSMYSAPYWDKVANETYDVLGLKSNAN